MRLGAWNRLAIVAGALLTLVGPTWFVISENSKNYKAHFDSYQACISLATQREDSKLAESCWDIWMNDYSTFGWTEWLEGVGIFAVISTILYGMIWLLVWVTKWVWRGRNTQV